MILKSVCLALNAIVNVHDQALTDTFLHLVSFCCLCDRMNDSQEGGGMCVDSLNSDRKIIAFSSY